MDVDDLDLAVAGVARSTASASSDGSAAASSDRSSAYKSSASQQQKSAGDAYFEAQLAKEMKTIAPELKQNKTLAASKHIDAFDDEFSDAFAPNAQTNNASTSSNNNATSSLSSSNDTTTNIAAPKQLKERKTLKPSTKQQKLAPLQPIVSPTSDQRSTTSETQQQQQQQQSSSITLPSVASTSSLTVPSATLSTNDDTINSAATAIVSESRHNPLSPSVSQTHAGSGPAAVENLIKDATIQQEKQQAELHTDIDKQQQQQPQQQQNQQMISQQSSQSQSTADVVSTVPQPEIDEWDALTIVREQQLAEQKAQAKRDADDAATQSIGGIKTKTIHRGTPITFDQSLELQSKRDDLQLLISTIQLYDFRQCSIWSRLRYRLFGVPKLATTQQLNTQRDIYFALCKAPVTHARLDDERMLCSLYQRLLGDALPPPSTGSHWELLGFQVSLQLFIDFSCLHFFEYERETNETNID
jgi:hypothetical protein